MVAKMTVAILGLGTMGVGMAANLLKNGFAVVVYNRTASKADALVAAGAKFAPTPAEAAKDADVVVCMVSDDAVSRETWTGKDGALAAAKQGAVLIDSSTLTPAWVEELATLAEGRGLSLLDAPVTGSRVQAEGGQLTFLVGGSEDALTKAMPALQAMSKQVIHLGPVGSGAKMKLINNFLCGVQIASLAEGLTWLERSGLDREKALEILKAGAPGSSLLAGISARMTSQDYGVNFLLKLMTKDMLYAQKAAAAVGVDLTTAAVARSRFEKAIEDGYGEQDMASVVEPVRKSQLSN